MHPLSHEMYIIALTPAVGARLCMPKPRPRRRGTRLDQEQRDIVMARAVRAPYSLAGAIQAHVM
jgi:hypothetical protein